MTTWQPSLGAWPDGDGFRFRVWAPEVRSLSLLLDQEQTRHEPQRQLDGTWTIRVPGCRAGTPYAYLVDGRGPFPDPASRFQPQGVHGPSETVDPGSFSWTDHGWEGLPLADLVFYELHVGTFTPEGTFAALAERLPYLEQLGVNAIELMPVADFPGQRNWGYDGVDLFAPARCYGRPDDLRTLVDRAHGLGLAVFLDVVYNHLGPDGNYTGVYSPHYFTKKHHTPWGDAVNLDGPGSDHVRAFFIENAIHWLREYHLDGLRLDATHAIVDDSPKHFLAELTENVRAAVPERRVHLAAEDHRNLAHMVRPIREGGWGLDAVWADDFHHQVRRYLSGDSEGYYRDYTGTITDLATTINRGWFFCGQHSEHAGELRGSDPTGLPQPAFVVCLQNHDQIGNRAFGERLSHEVDPAVFRAATVLLLCSPATPLLFMGQEWACSSPFRFFTDHNPELGQLVTEGRRREFRHFAAFNNPQAREKIPDPQSASTFTASRLCWDEKDRLPHDGTWQLHQALLQLRKNEPALRHRVAGSFEAKALDEATLLLRRRAEDGRQLVVVCRFRGGGVARIGGDLEEVLTTEQVRFCLDPQPPAHTADGIRFRRPGAAIYHVATS